MFRVLVAILMALTASAFLPLYNSVSAQEFNDDGYCDKVGDNHGDNKASEREFKEHLDKHICELSDCIDEESCEGSIRNYGDFKQTQAYKTSNELITDCFEDRHDLPDNKGKHLADYEIMDCAQGNYQDNA